MRARADLTVTRACANGIAESRITRLRSDAPIVLRPTIATGGFPLPSWLSNAAPSCVSVAAGAAGPLGGDDLGLTIQVEAGAALIVRTVGATLVLPDMGRRASRSVVTVHVADGGLLAWLPGPLIAARGCNHHAVMQVELDAGARLLVRDEIILGRHGEQAGAFGLRLRVCREGRPLYDQELSTRQAGSSGPAVMAGRKAVGSVLVVDPDWTPRPAPLNIDAPDTAILRLEGAVAITSLAADAVTLRRCMSLALGAVAGDMADREASILVPAVPGAR